MSMSEYPDYTSRELCTLKHEQVENDIREIKEDVKAINSKLWGGLVLVVLQVMGVLMIFIKGCAN